MGSGGEMSSQQSSPSEPRAAESRDPLSQAHGHINNKQKMLNCSAHLFLSSAPFPFCSFPSPPPIRAPSFHHNDRQKGLCKEVPKVPQDQRA